MIHFIKKIKSDYSIFRNILKLTDKKIPVIFYSEGRFYQKFSYSLVDLLAKKYPNQVYYVSSDVNDRLEDLKVNNLFIGKGILMNIFFSIVKAKFFFLTLTDLNNHSIKKNKNVEKYIYYNHSGSSTFQSYTEGSFDNYDIILCNGQYQLDEIRFRENKKNLVKKNLVLTGYFYFDYISKKIKFNETADEILVAPSWSYKYKNFINENVIDVIDELIKKNYKVNFRPHPEHFKRSENILKTIKDKFNLFHNFKFDSDSENIKSMEKAKCLITDTSDICLEFMILLNRPVLYLEGIDKIHNESYSDFKNFESIEKKFKNKFGSIISKKDIKNIDLSIENTLKEFITKIPDLNNFKNKYYFNFGKTIEEFEKIWEDKILKS
jgi:hypothetical protein